MSNAAKLWFQFVAFALKRLNSFNTALHTSSSKIGTMQYDMCRLLRTFFSNFIRPECLSEVPESEIYAFDYTTDDFSPV